jgi:hypothetical protein
MINQFEKVTSSNQTYPNLTLANPLITTDMTCDGSGYAVSGHFLYLGKLAEAYFFMTSGYVYFEYYFPVIWWTGIGATFQKHKNINNTCPSCYFANEKNVLNCLDDCVANNRYVITAVGDPGPTMSFNVFGALMNNNGGAGKYNEYQLPNHISIYSTNVSLEYVTVKGAQYIHGSWYRQLQSSSTDEWYEYVNSNRTVCWTTIASYVEQEYYGGTANGYYINPNLTEIVCGNKTVKCHSPTSPPTLNPTKSPVEATTLHPTPLPTWEPIPDLYYILPYNVCVAKKFVFHNNA